MTRPKLYPNHQHQWVSVTCGGVHEFGEDCNHESTLVRCTVCDFEAPRNLAGLDGNMTEPEFARGLEPGEPTGGPGTKVWWHPDTDTRCTHQDATGQCLDHQGHAGDHQYPQPEQETRA